MRYPNALLVIFASTCVLAFSGCGQKGDLYLPDIPPAPKVVSVNSDQEELGVSDSDVDQKTEEAKKKNHSHSSESD